jgi:retron-type reverse transcriptase
MKQYGDLWNKFIAWENLVLAAKKSRKGKRAKRTVQRFEYSYEFELLKLQRQLEEGIYQPGRFRSHWIYEPKKRMISAAPYRDRVVPHALMNVLEPILDKHFHDHSYACRKGKGTHAASERLVHLMKRNRYYLQCDIQKFFPSIDHEILKRLFRKRIKDTRLLRLMDLFVDTSNVQEPSIQWFANDTLFSPINNVKGLPIGNLTSQWFANWMLDGLDHYITSHLGAGHYVRYCDDFIVLHKDKAFLKELSVKIQTYLDTMRLKLHTGKLAINPVISGVTFVGYRTWSYKRLIRKSNILRHRRRLRWMQKMYKNGELSFDDIAQRLNSWMAHARTADCEGLIRHISKEWVFTQDHDIFLAS